MALQIILGSLSWTDIYLALMAAIGLGLRLKEPRGQASKGRSIRVCSVPAIAEISPRQEHALHVCFCLCSTAFTAL